MKLELDELETQMLLMALASLSVELPRHDPPCGALARKLGGYERFERFKLAYINVRNVKRKSQGPINAGDVIKALRDNTKK